MNEFFTQHIADNHNRDNSYRVAVKDSIDIAGLPTVAGCRALENTTPALIDADVVGALRSAQCHIIGKTNLHELAYGMSGVNHWAGTPTNAKFPDLIPGGSSSGSAVVVANGKANFSLGTDTGGSIRLPAACCGVYGFKPTFGRVSRKGVKPDESSLDCVGPFAQTPEMIIKAMEIIDPSFEACDEMALSEITLGTVPVEALEPIVTAINDFLVTAAIEITPKTLPLMDEAFGAGMTIINRETWQAFGHLCDSGLLGKDVEQRLRNAEKTSDAAVAEAEKIRQAFIRHVDAALEGVSALVMPTLPSFPMTLSDALDGKVDLKISSLVRPFNLSGHPAISIPLLVKGMSAPIGLQLIGRKGKDEELCEIARQVASFLPNT